MITLLLQFNIFLMFYYGFFREIFYWQECKINFSKNLLRLVLF
jgi:hypothetical protein